MKQTIYAVVETLRNKEGEQLLRSIYKTFTAKAAARDYLLGVHAEYEYEIVGVTVTTTTADLPDVLEVTSDKTGATRTLRIKEIEVEF